MESQSTIYIHHTHKSPSGVLTGQKCLGLGLRTLGNGTQGRIASWWNFLGTMNHNLENKWQKNPAEIPEIQYLAFYVGRCLGKI